jgi:UDPglucose 6-dehydrogenase
LLAQKILDHFHGTSDTTIALWGLAFKANTDDMREAASLTIIGALTEAGIRIRAFDPVANANAKSLLSENRRVEIVESQYEALNNAQALAVVTDWNQFRNPDFVRIKKMLKSPVIFDGRNLYSPMLMREMGITYISIGRQPVYNDSPSDTPLASRLAAKYLSSDK